MTGATAPRLAPPERDGLEPIVARLRRHVARARRLTQDHRHDERWIVARVLVRDGEIVVEGSKVEPPHERATDAALD